MLYDKRWDTKVEPLWSLADFIAWMETLPPTSTYDFCKPQTCLATQYLRARGAYKGRGYHIPTHIEPIVHGKRGFSTVAAAMQRARYLKASRWQRAWLTVTGRTGGIYSLGLFPGLNQAIEAQSR